MSGIDPLFSSALQLCFCAVLFPWASAGKCPGKKSAQPEKKEAAQAKKDFPGRNEIIPRATVIATRLAEADAQVQKAEILAPVYGTLDLVERRLGELEKQYTNWEEIKSWRLNRLRIVESAYADLGEQQKGQLTLSKPI